MRLVVRPILAAKTSTCEVTCVKLSSTTGTPLRFQTLQALRTKSKLKTLTSKLIQDTTVKKCLK